MSQIDLGPNRRARPAPLDVVVQRVERSSGGFVRVTFGGPALKSFVWPGPASHLKFFPVFETTDRGELRQEDAAGSRPLSRTYTPRSFDARAHELVIEFLLHATDPQHCGPVARNLAFVHESAFRGRRIDWRPTWSGHCFAQMTAGCRDLQPFSMREFMCRRGRSSRRTLRSLTDLGSMTPGSTASRG
jgi:NADPH-dependent ferric siderophore reductase